MRLIDADKLLKQSQLEPIGNGEYKEVWVVYEEDIDNAPTIEAEPVIHGKWERVPAVSEHAAACSECGWVHDPMLCGKHYCPNCGAKMEG